MVFIGNEWYHLDMDNDDFNNKLEELKKTIIDIKNLGGSENPIGENGEIMFPKSVCIVEFYNYTNPDEFSFMREVEISTRIVDPSLSTDVYACLSELIIFPSILCLIRAMTRS